MSGKDETDLVQNKEISTENEAEQSRKPNLDQSQDLSNGNATTVNGDSFTHSDENNLESTVSKPSTPSNWVQFENEDDSDKVYKYLISR